jgi:RNA recognition motif-containing protein
MSSMLYVANLCHTVDEDELERLFGDYGVVRSARVIEPSRAAAAGTRAAVVEMDSEREAAAAIAALDGSLHMGGKIAVGWAHAGELESVDAPRLSESMNAPGAAENSSQRGSGR